MKLAIRNALPLAMALSLAVPTPAQQNDQTFGTPKQTSIHDLMAVPQAYKNVWVTFTGTFGGIGQLHNPFFTRFTRSNHVNFHMWGDDARIWTKESFDNPCVTLFVSKLDDDTTVVLYQLQRYQRVQVTGVVRNSFQGKPWIEITEIVPQGQRYTTTSLGHLHRAHKYVESHEWKKAGVELSLAQDSGLPNAARGWIQYYRGLCYMSVGQPAKAQQAFAAARPLLQHAEQHDVDQRVALLQKDPKKGIDETVRKPQIAKSRRPFWEAVAKSKDEKDTSAPATPQR